jgi:hypothetical protein
MLTGLAITLWLVMVVAEGIRDLIIGLTTMYRAAGNPNQTTNPISIFLPPLFMWLLISAIATGLLIVGIKMGSWVLVVVILCFLFWLFMAISGIRQGWRAGENAKNEFVAKKQSGTRSSEQ